MIKYVASNMQSMILQTYRSLAKRVFDFSGIYITPLRFASSINLG